MMPAAKLWENTSAKGNRYMVGRMGSLRVLVLENNRRESDADNTHTLMFAEAPQRDGTRSQAAPAEPSRPASAPVHRRARRGGEKQQIDVQASGPKHGVSDRGCSVALNILPSGAQAGHWRLRR